MIIFAETNYYSMSLYNKLFDLFHKKYLMYVMLGLLISSCLGAAAAMLALHEGHGFIQMFQVGLLVTVCMGFNATILSDRKRKIVFNWGLLSISVSVVLLIIHLVF